MSGRFAISATVEVFEAHRRRLFGVAYRMLGSRPDAEDLVQDVYLRWHQSPMETIQSPLAFLLTITTRLCLDRLRERKKEHDHCVVALMPELIADDHVPSPEMQAELAGEISAAILAVLERLGPDERAAFLLREVFDYDYPEVARMCDKAEPACRQMIHRARSRVRDSRPRFSVSTVSRERILKRFLAAANSGDRNAIAALLAEEVECSSRRRQGCLPSNDSTRTAAHGPTLPSRRAPPYRLRALNPAQRRAQRS
jgi:RNA polymerase sigma-70 factor (ECF subfamily)